MGSTSIPLTLGRFVHSLSFTFGLPAVVRYYSGRNECDGPVLHPHGELDVEKSSVECRSVVVSGVQCRMRTANIRGKVGLHLSPFSRQNPRLPYCGYVGIFTT